MVYPEILFERSIEPETVSLFRDNRVLDDIRPPMMRCFCSQANPVPYLKTVTLGQCYFVDKLRSLITNPACKIPFTSADLVFDSYESPFLYSNTTRRFSCMDCSAERLTCIASSAVTASLCAALVSRVWISCIHRS